MKKLLTLTLILISTASYAADQYRIDLLIFRYTNTAFQGIEGNLDSTQAINLSAASATETQQKYQLLAPEQSKLKSRYNKLSHTANIQVLGLYSWIQPIYISNNLPVRLNMGDLVGLIKFSRSTFVNAELQIASDNQYVTLTRRIKYNELNYFDSAGLGILLEVSPLK